jgi:hypothetical protein
MFRRHAQTHSPGYSRSRFSLLQLRLALPTEESVPSNLRPHSRRRLLRNAPCHRHRKHAKPLCSFLRNGILEGKRFNSYPELRFYYVGCREASPTRLNGTPRRMGRLQHHPRSHPSRRKDPFEESDPQLQATTCSLSPLECAVTKNRLASPLESAVTKSLDLKSFRIRSYEKTGWGEARFVRPDVFYREGS